VTRHGVPHWPAVRGGLGQRAAPQQTGPERKKKYCHLINRKHFAEKK
jgi:hypothetical protein